MLKDKMTIERPDAFYKLVKVFILEELLMKEKVTLTELLDEGGKKLTCKIGKKVSWYLLEVKKDLQSHNLIKVSFTPCRVQCIRIKTVSKRKVKEWLSSHKGNSSLSSF